MDINEVKNKRKEKVISKIEKEITDYIIKYGKNKSYINCPNDLYNEVKAHFEEQGFKITREKYNIPDIDGYYTNEIGYNYYISI